MNRFKVGAVLMASIVVLAACSKSGAPEAGAPEGNAAAPAASGSAIAFVDTQEGKPLVIDAALFDTPAAKAFLTTGKNPYIGNADAVAKGKKTFQLYSCTQCHGPEAKGQVGPGLVGPTFRYTKDATNKGMFETIWHGTNGGMGAKGMGLMDPNDNTQGLKPDEILQVQAWIRSMSNGITGNE